MLVISVPTWKPGERNELLRRRLEKGIALPEGVTVLGEWTDLYGGREIMLLESNDPQALIAGTVEWVEWSDPMKVEVHPF